MGNSKKKLKLEDFNMVIPPLLLSHRTRARKNTAALTANGSFVRRDHPQAVPMATASDSHRNGRVQLILIRQWNIHNCWKAIKKVVVVV